MFDKEVRCFDEVAEWLDLARDLEGRALCLISENRELLSDANTRTRRSFSDRLDRRTSFDHVDIARDGVLTQYNHGITIGDHSEIGEGEIKIGIS